MQSGTSEPKKRSPVTILVADSFASSMSSSMWSLAWKTDPWFPGQMDLSPRVSGSSSILSGADGLPSSQHLPRVRRCLGDCKPTLAIGGGINPTQTLNRIRYNQGFLSSLATSRLLAAAPQGTAGQIGTQTEKPPNWVRSCRGQVESPHIATAAAVGRYIRGVHRHRRRGNRATLLPSTSGSTPRGCGSGLGLEASLIS